MGIQNHDPLEIINQVYLVVAALGVTMDISVSGITIC